MNLKEGALVDVFNATGAMQKLRVASYGIRPGNVMTYFPEANVLIPQDTDYRSKTPGFKSVPVQIRTQQPSSS
jgi:anaerobic selenocysteine-containing dehydrogenase